MKPFRKHAFAAALAFAAIAVGSAPVFAQGPKHVYSKQHHQVQPRAPGYYAYDYVAPSAPASALPAISGWKDLH